MIANNFDYVKPASLIEALGYLATDGKPLAGGMSLIPMMKLRLAAPERLVDLSGLGLNTIVEGDGWIRIGAMSTHHEVESSSLLRAKCPLLAEAASNIGDVQVRNMGTIGGSTAHADPAADYPASLLALEASVIVASASGTRKLAVSDLLVDALTVSLEPGELITEVHVPVETAGTGVTYRKVVQPASGYAVVGIAARVRKDARGAVTFARIGVTGLASKAFRATGAEAAITSGASVEDAAALVTEGVDANGDTYASADYRSHLARVHAARAIRTALQRAAGS
jgi:aerobic carbon-monoxide dehydrogenase medium subunit